MNNIVNSRDIFLQIVDNSRNPLELVREFIANSWDVKANKVNIKLEYIDNKLNIILENNGPGLTGEEIDKYILSAGNSTKTFEDDNIGNKGIGTLLFLKCSKIVVESIKDGVLYKNVWNEPYRDIQEKRINESNGNFIGKEDTKVSDDTSTMEDISFRILIEGYIHSKNLIYFHHQNVADYIKRFTKCASIDTTLEGCNADFKVLLNGLEYDEIRGIQNEEGVVCISTDTDDSKNTYARIVKTKKDTETIDYGYRFPQNIKVEDINNEYYKTYIKGKSDAEKKKNIQKAVKKDLVSIYTSNDEEFKEFTEIKYIDKNNEKKIDKLEFIICHIGESKKTEYDNMLKKQRGMLPSYKQIASERYGVYLCKDYFPFMKYDNGKFTNVGGGSSGILQYLALFNSKDVELIMDRTAPALNEDLTLKIEKTIIKAMTKADKLVKEKLDKISEKIIASENEGNIEIETPLDNEDNSDTGSKNTNNNEEQNDSSSSNVYEDSSENIKDNEDTSTEYKGTRNEDEARERAKKEAEKEFKKEIEAKRERIYNLNNRKKAILKGYNDLIIREPDKEGELSSILAQVVAIKPDIFNFEIVDYSDRSGIDLLGKYKNKELTEENCFYIELKKELEKPMNHKLDKIKYVICWRIATTTLNKGKVVDKNNVSYILNKDNDTYYLINEEGYKVDVIELKTVIEKKFGCLFS